MPALPVNALFAGIQSEGYWAGTPTLTVRLMEHPDAAQLIDYEPLDEQPLQDRTCADTNEVTLNTLLAGRGRGDQFARVGVMTLTTIVAAYRERHVLLTCREPGRYDIGPAVQAFLTGGRSVQIETTGAVSLEAPGAWITLRLPASRATSDMAADLLDRSDEVQATVRWRADLDRVETLFGHRSAVVFLRPSGFAEPWVHRQCVLVASRHHRWRVTRSVRSSSFAGAA